ncbi:Mobile element protein [Minicystis rosea]|nr:Mobile element protein [Minicystis rosea]
MASIGRLRKVDEAFRRRVAQLLKRTPDSFGWRRPTWTRELLCLQMKQEGRPEVAVCTMGRVLARLGARLGMPKPVVLCPWKRDAREARLAEIRALEASASPLEPVLYSDEVDIHPNPKIGRDWMLPGHQRRVVTPGKNEKFYLAGALDVRTGVLHTTGTTRKSAALFCDLLEGGCPRAFDLFGGGCRLRRGDEGGPDRRGGHGRGR